ncbi:MAG: hypothetical protein JKX91_00940 [Rhizobiaceae bacterium]|nr:hypothetical protein [Rhizobiaceae bacterium]
MEKILLSLTDAFAQAPYKVLKYKSFVLAGLIVMTSIMVYGIFTRTTMDMTTDSFLDEADPAAIALDEFREQFGSDESVFLVYRAKDGNVFSRESMEAAQQLTDDLRNWQSLDRSQYPESVNGITLEWEELNHIRGFDLSPIFAIRKVLEIACFQIAWCRVRCRKRMRN